MQLRSKIFLSLAAVDFICSFLIMPIQNAIVFTPTFSILPSTAMIVAGFGFVILAAPKDDTITIKKN